MFKILIKNMVYNMKKKVYNKLKAYMSFYHSPLKEDLHPVTFISVYHTDD